MKWFWRALEIAVGALFVYAGALKAWDPIELAEDIDHYHVLPWAIGVRLAFYLPWLEILSGVALLACRFTAGARGILTALMLLFIVASILAKVRGIDVSCGCFGHAARNLSFSAHLAIDFAILAALLATWWNATAPRADAAVTNP